MSSRICVVCGKEFESPTGTAKYCSSNCKEKARIERNRVDMVCPQCGKHFMGSPDHGAKFCSLACAAASTSITKMLTCIDCGKQFEFHGRTRKLRCDDCWRKHRSQQTMQYRKAKHPEVQIGVGSGHAQNPNMTPEERAKHAEHLANRRALYRKKVEEGKYSGTYTYRDILTGHDVCELCGYSAHQSAIVVHHKDMDRTNNKPENLAILCSNCHAVVHALLRKYMKQGDTDVTSYWDKVIQEYSTFN